MFPPKTFVMMRGLPGSGKSSLAREIAGRCDGHYISADLMLESSKGYRWAPQLSTEAHAICRTLVEQAMTQGHPCIILDNMNLWPSRAKPYVEVAKRYGYRVEVVEPQTPWCRDVDGLLQNGTHRVFRDQMESYLKTYLKYPKEKFLELVGL